MVFSSVLGGECMLLQFKSAIEAQNIAFVAVFARFVNARVSLAAFRFVVGFMLSVAIQSNSISSLRAICKETALHSMFSFTLFGVMNDNLSTLSDEVADVWHEMQPARLNFSLCFWGRFFKVKAVKHFTAHHAHLIERFAKFWSVADCECVFTRILKNNSPERQRLLHFFLSLPCAPDMLLRENVLKTAVSQYEINIVQLVLADPRCLPPRDLLELDFFPSRLPNAKKTALLKLLLGDSRVLPVVSENVFRGMDEQFKKTHAVIPCNVIPKRVFEKSCELPRALKIRAARVQAKAANRGNSKKKNIVDARKRIQAFVFNAMCCVNKNFEQNKHNLKKTKTHYIVNMAQIASLSKQPEQPVRRPGTPFEILLPCSPRSVSSSVSSSTLAHSASLRIVDDCDCARVTFECKCKCKSETENNANSDNPEYQALLTCIQRQSILARGQFKSRRPAPWLLSSIATTLFNASATFDIVQIGRVSETGFHPHRGLLEVRWTHQDTQGMFRIGRDTLQLLCDKHKEERGVLIQDPTYPTRYTEFVLTSISTFISKHEKTESDREKKEAKEEMEEKEEKKKEMQMQMQMQMQMHTQTKRPTIDVHIAEFVI